MSVQSAVQIWRELEAKGARVRTRAVTADDIAAAEKELSVRLPPSYVELVTTLGAPAVLPQLPARLDPNDPENLDYAVLTPAEIVERTYAMRDSVEPAYLEDASALERVQDMLDEAILVQLGLDASEGYVLLLDTEDADGEQKAAEYSHELLEQLDWSTGSEAVFDSFSAAQARVAALIVESLSEYSEAASSSDPG